MCDEILHHIQSKGIEPLFIEQSCYSKAEVEQSEKIWNYKKKLSAEEKEYKL